MQLKRSVFAGCTDYTGASFDEILAHLGKWKENTEYSIKELKQYRSQVEQVKDRLYKADRIFAFIDKFVDWLERHSKDFTRLLQELEISVEERHLYIVEQIAENSVELEQICIKFKQTHIENPLKDESLRSLLDHIYVEAREQAIDYQDLSNLLSRLRTFVGTRHRGSGVSVDDVDTLELKPNLFGIGINLNHLIKRLAYWRKSRN